MKQTIIIGAGIAGLAAAVRLAVAGHSVDVYEANDGPGGKLSQFALGDYRFDFGPSLFTMPQYVDELFRLAGEDPADHFEYHRLPDVCHYWWNDGTTFVAPGDTDQLADAAAATFSVPRERVADFMAGAAKKYELTGRTFLEKSLHKAGTWLDWQVAGAMLRVPQFDLFTSMHAVHERDLQHPKLVQLFDRFATYNGSNPYKAPGLLSMIPHFEHHFGAYLPKGGMFDISRSIYELGKRLGVRFHFGQRVEEILRKEEKVVGVRVQEVAPQPEVEVTAHKGDEAGTSTRSARGEVAARLEGLEHRVAQREHRVKQSSPSDILQDISSDKVSDVPPLLGAAEGSNEANGVVGEVSAPGRTVPASTVVCNMDVFLAYDRLLPGAKRPERTLRQQKSTSAVIFYWGIKREFPELGVHNIFFSDDYANEFACLEAGKLADDVTIYVNVSSKLVTEDAPSGSENWFVMVNAPADTGQDWDEVVGRLRSRVLSSLQKQLLAPAAAPLETLIEAERVVTPPEIERLTGSHQGALYGTSSNNTMAAFMRHPNFSNRIDGLYFLGGSVHPGGGVPLCLLSAKITADLIAPTA